jgi:hypothetical protein
MLYSSLFADFSLEEGARDRTKHEASRKQPKSARNKLLQAKTGLAHRILPAAAAPIDSGKTTELIGKPE